MITFVIVVFFYFLCSSPYLLWWVSSYLMASSSTALTRASTQPMNVRVTFSSMRPTWLADRPWSSWENGFENLFTTTTASWPCSPCLLFKPQKDGSRKWFSVIHQEITLRTARALHKGQPMFSSFYIEKNLIKTWRTIEIRPDSSTLFLLNLSLLPF